MRKFFCIAIFGLSPLGHTQDYNISQILNHLSPEMARFQLELGELPHQKKRSFEAFRLGLKTHEKVYEELADHKQADICSINIPARNLVIANVEYANQLNSYYDENYLYETLLQALVEEAILNKCKL